MNKNNEKLKDIIHQVFVKYDILGVISKGFPDDEYLLEESKLYSSIYDKLNVISSKIIYESLLIIIKEWFGTDELHGVTLKTLEKMSVDIYDLIRKN